MCDRTRLTKKGAFEIYTETLFSSLLRRLLSLFSDFSPWSLADVVVTLIN
jgi:hypothetical protein